MPAPPAITIATFWLAIGLSFPNERAGTDASQPRARPNAASLFVLLVLTQHTRPVRVSALDGGRLVCLPQLLRTGIEVQVKLAVDDLPLFGIAGCDIALADRPGAVATKLRCKRCRIGLELGQGIGRGEQPGRTFVLQLVGLVPAHRPTVQ